MTDVFPKDGRAVPVFNDKHLSWKWEWAKEMVDLSREAEVPVPGRLVASGHLADALARHAVWGRSRRCSAWRWAVWIATTFTRSRRSSAWPSGARRRNRRCRRQGSARCIGLEGDGCRRLGSRWLGTSLFEACLWRSHTLAQPRLSATATRLSPRCANGSRTRSLTGSNTLDGTKATMLLLNGLVGDFTFAAKLRGQSEPLSTLFHLPPNPNVVYSAELMSKAEEMFMTGKPPYPIERTLLTTGMVEACVRSLGTGQNRIETPHLAIRYEAPRESLFAKLKKVALLFVDHDSPGSFTFSDPSCLSASLSELSFPLSSATWTITRGRLEYGAPP